MIVHALFPSVLRRAAIGAALVAATSLPASAQFRGVRFEVASVGDTTVTFRTGKERWIRAGQRGIAVDPRRRDALVARLRVIRVGGGTVNAVVTGQTTAVSTEHVVVLEEPPKRWWRSRPFWSGLLAGAALGTVAGSQF
jgi:hypothetical protein